MENNETQRANAENVCLNCGAILQKGQEFCTKCGQKVGSKSGNNLNSDSNQFDANVKKKKSRVLLIIIAAVLIVCIVIGVVLANILGAKNAEEAKDKYIANVEEFLQESLDAGINLEDIGDTVVTYWYENIYDDLHGSDINEAIAAALDEKSSEISSAEHDDTDVRNLYSLIKNVPDEISEEDVDDIEELCDAAKELYNVYIDFYGLATSPSGSYNSYTEDYGETKDELISCIRELEALL